MLSSNQKATVNALLLISLSIVFCWIPSSSAAASASIDPREYFAPYAPAEDMMQQGFIEQQSQQFPPYEMNEEEESDDEEDEEENGRMVSPPQHELQFRQTPVSTGASNNPTPIQSTNTPVQTTTTPGPSPQSKFNPQDCATPGKCVEAQMQRKIPQGADAEHEKLQNELLDIRTSIGSHTRGIANEENWISQVQDILKTYTGKVQKVQDHIQYEHKLIKDLIKRRREVKKKQREIKLSAQLKTATEDLKVLQGQLGQVKEKETEFDKLKDGLKSKVTQIESELNKMQGSGTRIKVSPDDPNLMHDNKEESGEKNGERSEKKERNEKK